MLVSLITSNSAVNHVLIPNPKTCRSLFYIPYLSFWGYSLSIILALLFTLNFAHAQDNKAAAAVSGAKPQSTQAETTKKTDIYRTIADELLKNCEGADKKIAVAGFSYSDGRDSMDGGVVGERITTELVKTKKFKIIERKQIEKVLEELKLQRSGLIDSASAKNIGKMLGADWVVVGTLTELPDKQIELNTRMVGVESGEIINASINRIKKDWMDQYKELLAEKAIWHPAAKEASTQPIRRPRVMVFLSDVDRGILRQESVSEKTLQSRLKEKGFVVISTKLFGHDRIVGLRKALKQDAAATRAQWSNATDLIVWGETQTQPGTSGVRGMYSCVAEASIELILSEKNGEIDQPALKPVKGFGSTLERACLAALKTAGVEWGDQIALQIDGKKEN